MALRRRTTLTHMIVASPFELRAIRLNTYYNVIINSQAVGELVKLIKQALLAQSRRLDSRQIFKGHKTTNLDENPAAYSQRNPYNRLTQKTFNKYNTTDLDGEVFELSKSTNARKSANFFVGQDSSQTSKRTPTGGFFGKMFSNKKSTTNINQDKEDIEAQKRRHSNLRSQTQEEEYEIEHYDTTP